MYSNDEEVIDKSIRIGYGQITFCEYKQMWCLPGGTFTDNRKVAAKAAQKIHQSIVASPLFKIWKMTC